MPAPKNVACAGQADHFVSLTPTASLVFRSVAGVVTNDPAKLSNIRRDICIGIMEEAGSTLRFADGRPPRRSV